MKKSRFFYLHHEVNSGKVASLEALQVEYTAYLTICVLTMLQARRQSDCRGMPLERNSSYLSWMRKRQKDFSGFH